MKRPWRFLGAGAMVLAAFAFSGCTNEVASDLDAPIQTITATDVVVLTNIQAVMQSAQTSVQMTHSFSSFSAGTAAGDGMNVTSGPSTSDGQISYAVTAGGNGIVFVGWNHADQHCVGELDFNDAPPTPVHGVATAGVVYYFIAPAASSTDCDASSFAAMASAPSHWPYAPSDNVPHD